MHSGNHTVGRGQLAGEHLIRTLHERHANALHLWAARRFDDDREAEEVVQDTLVLAWRKYDQFDPARGTERQWLFGILKNVSSSRFRGSQRRLRLVKPVGTVAGDSPAAVAHIDDSMVEYSHVVDALLALSDEHREVIVAAYYEGLLIRQIADRLGLPEGTVKSRLYYALRRLRTELEERSVLE